ncbi:bifunctional acetate--CoA ligase family protein/GNAT family N-acetyltransferase [Lentzea flaviverrucosa]|uniref:Acyl-CoA synthetase (NDP forming) n=1 Tax=Lentzea flaviverrucosa TaxID=200379 RepID=A0A1H9XWN7_9PSEU|nr:bifunctional GNAT family N-acetyltransferase/acetate--CoA ligase family protein [Lentzea flaviverrucosa]RDI34340.1 acyl-CoA synthetase (NDP forming) [Lentzea flaviverrucosa]SES50489.1 Acyl-CoA synthetase (NDP forming) [Lentzea flaviverrucosa]
MNAAALLTDGSVVTVRELGPDDVSALLALHRALPIEDQYLRFFSTSPRQLEDFVERMVSPDAPRHVVLGAFRGDRLLGAASYVVVRQTDFAEVALVVSHAEQAHGVGTLLLEHLASLARSRGVRRFTADVLTINGRMLRVFTSMGLVTSIVPDGEVIYVELVLEPGDHYLDAMSERESRADVASLTHVLRPTSIAVVGAGRSPDSVGHAVLHNLVEGNFTGDLYAVNPHAKSVVGVECYASINELPEAPDLAVLCVPAKAVPAVAEECGRKGVRALVVISSGVDAGELLKAVRAHGMRLVGPNCLGVSTSAPGVRMNATFAAHSTLAGHIGLITQSGGIAIGVQEELRRLGLGLSNLVSTGDKLDISSNDLLMWWEHDQDTRIIALYLESFGNPRKFARIARRVAAAKPVLAIRAATSEAGQRAAASHTASTATPSVTRDALFRQAGVIAVDSVPELTDAVMALSCQPLPTGRAVAVLSNAGGLGVLAADACVRQGLHMAALGDETRKALARLVPETASLQNPVDTTAVVDEKAFARCLDVIGADPAVDAVITVTVPTALGDPTGGVHDVNGKPVLAVRTGQTERLAGEVPCYPEPARAAAALARLVERADWLARPREFARLNRIDLDAAKAIVSGHEGWLPPDEVMALLTAFGLPVLGGTLATTPEHAVAAQQAYDAPVALKAVADDLLHKSKGGGVELGVADGGGVAEAFRTFQERFGDRLRGVFVQPMASGGRELLVGVVTDEKFGPLVVTGLGGVDTDLLDDRAAALAPLSTADADELLHGFRSAGHVLAGVNEEAVREVLLRVAELAGALPEVVELDINPLVLTDTGCVVVDARVRVAPAEHADPFLRRLRTT